MVRRIGLCNFSTLHIDLDNTESTDEVGIVSFDTDAVDCLVFCYRLRIQGRNIGDISIGLYKVDIGIVIDGYQTFGLFIPGDEFDVGI